MKRIRGKRNRRDSSNPSVTRSRRGKPMRDPVSLKPTRRSINEHILHNQEALGLREQQRQPGSATLESLPLEILYQIFFLSLELNLLRTSKSLEQALSTSAVHSALILFAYFEDDTDYPVETKFFQPADYRLLSAIDKLNLQVKLWRCNWCDTKLFQACLPKLWKLAYVQAWYQGVRLDLPYAREIDNVQVGELDKDNLSATFKARRPPGIDDEANLGSYFSSQKNWSPYGILNYTYIYSASILIQEGDSPYHYSATLYNPVNPIEIKSVIGARYLPEKLLCQRPWTPDQILCLQLLRQGAANVREGCNVYISPKALFSGMANAIQEHNVTALKILLEIYVYYFEKDEEEQRSSSSHILPITLSRYHPIPLEIFHLATKQGEASNNLLKLLVRAGLEDIPKDDETITSWALHYRHDERLPKLLLHYMEVTDTCNEKFHFRLGEFIEFGWSPTSFESRSLPFKGDKFLKELHYRHVRTDIPAASRRALWPPDSIGLLNPS